MNWKKENKKKRRDEKRRDENIENDVSFTCRTDQRREEFNIVSYRVPARTGRHLQHESTVLK
jgi:hypothetical protein